jgi:2-methylcitrate dehydratase
MTQVQELARFVQRISYEGLSQEAIRELKVRILDALGCAIGALEGQPVRRIREQTAEFGGNPLATLIGGGRTAPDRAAL